jgi:Mrp family chromosome partitioning ATPase
MNQNRNPEKRVEENKRIEDKRAKIRHVIVVMSGKGGVGKSTIAVNVAFGLAKRDYNVGIMDVDIHGPNIPKMLGIESRRFTGSEHEIEPVEVLPNLKAASIAFAGYPPDTAFIWRGPLKIGIIRQFLADVQWGPLDYLVIDTPPGTGDEALTVCQTISNIDGAVIVTTPQGVSVLDSRKTIDFARKLNVPIAGLIENMSGFICPDCGKRSDIFGSGGGMAAARELDVPFLGEIPITPDFVVSGDRGKPPVGGGAAAAGRKLDEIIDRLEEQLGRRN